MLVKGGRKQTQYSQCKAVGNTIRTCPMNANGKRKATDETKAKKSKKTKNFNNSIADDIIVEDDTDEETGGDDNVVRDVGNEDTNEGDEIVAEVQRFIAVEWKFWMNKMVIMLLYGQIIVNIIYKTTFLHLFMTISANRDFLLIVQK